MTAAEFMKAQQVFTPGSFPIHTYVSRDEHRLEERLSDGLATPGQLISISGPSKSGKTVFVEKVVGIDNLITVTGASISRATDLWDLVLDWMELPASRTSDTRHSTSSSASVSIEGEGNAVFAKGRAGATGSIGSGRESGEGQTHARRGMQQVLDEIADSEFVLLLDDFHYMPRDVQDDVAKQLKEAVRLGLKVITAAVSHRSDDVVRANPELRGRVNAIDFDYWQDKYLREIGERGFGLLGAQIDAGDLGQMVREASGSPQLMQAICLQACFELDLREKRRVPSALSAPPAVRERIFEKTVATTDFRSLVDALDTGPPTRGTERKTYDFSDGSEGDVYRAILKAIAADPPKLSFTYEEISRRLGNLCSSEAPVGSSVTSSCQHMAKIARRNFPRERPVDWDDERGGVLDLPDPYLLFYLRWSSRLKEA